MPNPQQFNTIGIPNFGNGFEYNTPIPITGEGVINRFNRTRTEMTQKQNINKFRDNPAQKWADQKLSNISQGQQAIKKTRAKAIAKNKKIAELQEQLYREGYFPKGTTYEQAVDGVNGKLTQQALSNKNSSGSAVYLHYPNFNGQAANALTIGGVDIGKAVLGSGNVLPVGHGETIVFDNNGNATHIRYGRYLNGTGKVRPTVKGGNWKITSFPKRNKNESIQQYLKRVSNQSEMADAKLGKYEAIEVPNINSQKVIQYAMAQANDPNRPTYGLTNTCATGAEKALKAGMSQEQLEKVNDWTNAITNLGSISPANNGIKQTVYGLIPGSTNRYAADIRKIGKSYTIK